MHDRRDGVEKGERVFAAQPADRIGERRRGQRPGRNDHAVPVLGRQPGDFAAVDCDQRMIFERGRVIGRGKFHAIDRERAARRHLVGVGRAHDQRPEPAHLFVQQADRVGVGGIGAEGIGADELGQAFRLVRGGHSDRPHLVQHDGHAAARDLPGRFGPGETAADDVDGLWGRCHGL